VIGATRTLDSHVCQLRPRLNAAGGGRWLDKWGVCYGIVAPAQTTSGSAA
jgi:hypothetical protein